MSEQLHEKTIDSIYLNQLEYDPALESKWYAFFVRRPRFIFLVLFLILLAGSISLRALPIESNPEVEIGVVYVAVVLPGASPSVMEELITKKIEKQVAKVKGIDTVTSTSRNSSSTISVQFLSNADVKQGTQDIRDAVDGVKGNFPDGTKEPIIKEVSFDDSPIWIFSIAGPYDGFHLYSFAEKIQNELEKNPLVSEANISGGDQTEFTVWVDPARLTSYGISLDAVNSAISGMNLAFPIGNYTVGDYTHVLTVDERYYTIEKVKTIPVGHLGDTGVVTLGDLGTVEETAKERTSISRMSSKGSKSDNAVTISVVKKKGGSIVDLIDHGQASLQSMQSSGILPSDMRVVTILDLAERIRLDLHSLIRDGMITVLLVFLVLCIFVGVREALVAGIAAPIVFFMTFSVMSIDGQTLNFLSMFALILSLGLLVDDAIVVISAINQYQRTGKFTTMQVALLVLRDFQKVLISTTLTVVWIFSAMLFMTGLIGKFIYSIPFIMTVTLLASIVIALTVNPWLAVFFEMYGDQIGRFMRFMARSILIGIVAACIATVVFFVQGDTLSADMTRIIGIGCIAMIGSALVRRFIVSRLIKAVPLSRRETIAPVKVSRWQRYIDHGILEFSHLENIYERILKNILLTRWRSKKFVGMVALLFFVALALPVMGILHSEFFPKTDQDVFTIGIEAEPGTSLEKTSELVLPIEQRLLREPEIASFTTTVGSSSSLNSRSTPTASSNLANISVNLIKKEYGRKETSMSISDRLRTEFAKVQTAKVTVSELAGGPPAGADFSIDIKGDDFAIMDHIASDITHILATIPGAINIDTSRKPLPMEFRFTIDPKRLAVYDITLPQVASFLANVTVGHEATTIYKGTDEVIVRSRYESGAVDTLDKIKDLKLKSNKGQDVALRDIILTSPDPSVFSIDHKDQKRVVTVSAAAAKITNGTEIMKAYQERMKNYVIPHGYVLATAGSNDESAKSVISLFVALGFGMLLIIGTLVVLFDSYRQAVIVLVTIPLSLIGVFFGLMIFRQTLSFPSLIGLVALFGIVVRNGIILFDKINLNRSHGISFAESIVDAGKTRLEPVVLTSLCTMFGMIPLTVSNPTWQSLGLAIIFGLFTSTIFTLLVLPTLYSLVVPQREQIEA